MLDELNREHKATMIQTHWRMALAVTTLKGNVEAAVAVQRIVRGALQRPKFQAELVEKREEAKLENQVLALQRKLEEAEKRRLDAEKRAEEKAQQAVESCRANEDSDEKKEASVASAMLIDSLDEGESGERRSGPSAQFSVQQKTLMDESRKMLEYLRKEVFKLRSQNAQMRTDFDLLKDNNQRLMDANVSAGASFAALNQHTKQLARSNEKLSADLSSYKQQVSKLSVTQVELREELKMKQATYVAELHSRLQYQQALSMIVEICQGRSLVEDVLKIADACERDYMSGPTGVSAGSRLFSTPKSGEIR